MRQIDLQNPQYRREISRLYERDSKSKIQNGIMSSVESASISTDAIWRLKVEQYHAMIQAGILTDDDPIELLEGWLVLKMPKNPAHRVTTRLVRDALESIRNSFRKFIIALTFLKSKFYCIVRDEFFPNLTHSDADKSY